MGIKGLTALLVEHAPRAITVRHYESSCAECGLTIQLAIVGARN